MSMQSQVIRRTFVIQDRSLKALEKTGVPHHLWNEILALPEYKASSVTIEKPKTPPPVVEVPEEESSKNSEQDEILIQKMRQVMRDNYLNYYSWLETCSSYWQDEIEKNEFRRSYYNKKRSWSAKDIRNIERIDRRLEYCQMRLEKILKNQPIIEDEYEESVFDDDVSVLEFSLDDEF